MTEAQRIRNEICQNTFGNMTKHYPEAMDKSILLGRGEENRSLSRLGDEAFDKLCEFIAAVHARQQELDKEDLREID